MALLIGDTVYTRSDAVWRIAGVSEAGGGFSRGSGGFRGRSGMACTSSCNGIATPCLANGPRVGSLLPRARTIFERRLKSFRPNSCTVV